MKNKVFVIWIIALVWVGCDRREIPTFDTKEYYIEFEKATVDSTIFTFIYHPTADYYDLPIVMQIAGEAAGRDLAYKLSVNEKLSSAEVKHYTMPEKTVIRAGHYQDTCYLRLNKTEDLDGRKIRLVLYLEETSDFAVGKQENAAFIIQFSNTVDRPAWWDSTIEQYYLGTYSEKKFILFLQVTEADLTGASDSQKRAVALKFKQYLIDHKGEPETLENNGQPMTVPVRGLE